PKLSYIAFMVFHFLKHYMFSKRSGAVIKIISWLCLLGIGLSVAAMIVVLNVMNGLNDAIYKRLLSMDPHISINTAFEELAVDKQQALKDSPAFVDAKFFTVVEEDMVFRTIDALFSG